MREELSKFHPLNYKGNLKQASWDDIYGCSTSPMKTNCDCCGDYTPNRIG